MTVEPPLPVVEVVLAVHRTEHGRTVVDVRTTSPPLAYGSIELVELPLLLEAVVADHGGAADGVCGVSRPSGAPPS